MTKSEERECQNCKREFIFEPDDFEFYEKMRVPPPTWCPLCRLQRRLIWRNERNLSRRSCDLCKKEILSMYGNEVKFPVYCPACWKGDAWDSLSYGREYNFSKPFFEQYRSLMDEVPRPSLSHNNTNVNCDYANMIQDVKNVYFSFSVIWESEDVYYSNNVDRSRSIVDSMNVSESEMVYGSMGSVKNYRSRYCYWSSGCVDCTFMLDASGCSNCFGCVGLRNRQYCIFNEEYSKEDYKKTVASFDIGSYKNFLDFQRRFEELALKFPRKYARIINSVRSTGDEMLNCKNVRYGFNVSGVEDGKYLFRCPGTKQAMDACHCGKAEFVYEHGMGGSSPGLELRFIVNGMPGQHHVTYSDYCGSSSYLFGCVGVKNKEYCILNKQYSKEAFDELVPRITRHMDQEPYIDDRGRVYKYGEFVPPAFSPFAYNESVIQEYVPLTKERAEELGYGWKVKEKKGYNISVGSHKITDHIKDVNDSITTQIIGCSNEGREEGCTTAFRIVPEELAFYRRMEIPLPRYCPNCRHATRLKKRNPVELWHRNCMCNSSESSRVTSILYINTRKHFHGNDPCPNQFETSYAPDRNETVYCETCYNSEVV
ncbi:hypothetical protein HY967_04570 [Candidatus Jorgensenbacteria bacterium]|nr:hypothetical protein [Candidatus Jorgensenbacteria bacterium]